jgi:UDP-N-acetylglucosamine 2-epimerase (non-hydrolysing)
MDAIFFKQLNLPEPKYKLEVGSGTQAEQLGKMVIKIENVLTAEVPTHVIVQGDTNSVLAGAMAASKMNIKIGHVEAGLRSYDRKMPEEINRIVTDHVSDLLFAPTEIARDILIQEGINVNSIYKTGNTVVDALKQNLDLAGKTIQDRYIYKFPYFLVTLHRSENVDNVVKFTSLIKSLNAVAEKMNLMCVYPIHPRAEKMININKINIGEILLIPPTDYLSFLYLMRNAKVILTDSGGVQEEACVLKVPCVTLRETTERPETIQLRANKLAGSTQKVIIAKTAEALKSSREWGNPYGDGDAAERIIKIIKNGEAK